MDALAIQNYALPIELMMENAGLQLALLVSSNASRENTIGIGAGPGNNGGGGLVAARRLAGWGYRVFIHIPDESLKPLPAIQYKRAISFGANPDPLVEPAIFADAYFGFSQRLPLPTPLLPNITVPSSCGTTRLRVPCLQLSCPLITDIIIFLTMSNHQAKHIFT